MKKLVVSLAAAGLIFGIMTTSVSAEQYEVKQGDTLAKIANQYHTTVDDLMNINDLHSTTIYTDQTLNIDENPDKDVNSIYKVREGDTLSGIADEFDVSVTDIQKWNDLSSDLIVVGQELELNGSNNEQNVSVESEQSDRYAKTDNQTEKTASLHETDAENTTEKSENNVDKSDNVSEKTPKENDNSNEQSREKSQSESPEGETVSATATAYSASCNGCSGVTSTGVDLNENPNKKVIAVDPDVIPLGSEVYVEGYGYATAEDTGGDIQGDRIDLHVPSEEEALEWGSQDVEITVVE